MGKYKSSCKNNNNNKPIKIPTMTDQELENKYGILGNLNNGVKQLAKMHPYIPEALLARQLKLFYVIDNMPKEEKNKWLKVIDDMPEKPDFRDFPDGMPDIPDALSVEKTYIHEYDFVNNLNCISGTLITA
jgi:hypothetical protein